MKLRAASITGVGLLYPNDLAISKAVSPLTSRCTTRRPSMSPPQQHCAISAKPRIRVDRRQALDRLAAARKRIAALLTHQADTDIACHASAPVMATVVSSMRFLRKLPEWEQA